MNLWQRLCYCKLELICTVNEQKTKDKFRDRLDMETDGNDSNSIDKNLERVR